MSKQSPASPLVVSLSQVKQGWMRAWPVFPPGWLPIDWETELAPDNDSWEAFQAWFDEAITTLLHTERLFRDLSKDDSGFGSRFARDAFRVLRHLRDGGRSRVADDEELGRKYSAHDAGLILRRLRDVLAAEQVPAPQAASDGDGPAGRDQGGAGQADAENPSAMAIGKTVGDTPPAEPPQTREPEDRKAAAPRKSPPPEAFAAYRASLATGKKQQELAALMTAELNRPISQGQVSRWLQSVKQWLEAGNVLPDLPPIRQKPTPISPKHIDLGRRQDGRAPPQRDRCDSDSTD